MLALPADDDQSTRPVTIVVRIIDSARFVTLPAGVPTRVIASHSAMLPGGPRGPRHGYAFVGSRYLVARTTSTRQHPRAGGCVDRRRPGRTRRHPAEGTIRVRGAKNLVSKAMVAALLGDEPSRLYDVPRIRDVEVVRGLLELHGVKVTRRRGGRRAGPRPLQRARAPRPTRSTCTPARAGSRSCSAVRCCTASATPSSPTWAAATSARARSTSTSRRCASSARSWRRRPRGCTSPRPNGLHGTKFALPYPSVGATEQVLLTAVLAEGVTELRNAAVEPEIIDLICVLQKMGAIIKVHTDRVIEIQGVPRLGGYSHRPIPDRIEAASWAAAALATRGDVEVLGRPAGRHDDLPEHLPLGRRRVRGHRRRARRARLPGPGGRHPLLAPRRRAAAPWRWRPTCTPGS